jgi:hypothetical protein
MTKDEILNLPAGEEMDTLIAERVMGFSFNKYGHSFTGKGHPGWHDLNKLPNYSTDMAAAWEVVEQRQKNGYCFDADGNALRRRIRFGVGQEIGEAETMPLAICRAALLAVMEAS